MLTDKYEALRVNVMGFEEQSAIMYEKYARLTDKLRSFIRTDKANDL